MLLLSAASAPVTLAEEPGAGQVLLLILYLILILVGVYFATRLFARVAQRAAAPRAQTGARFQPGRHIHLVDRLALDRERSILLFEADGKRYLVGVSGESFVKLSESEAPPYEPPAEGATGAAFKDLLSAWKRRGTGSEEGERNAPEG